MYSSTCDINVEQSFGLALYHIKCAHAKGQDHDPNPPSPFRITIPTLSYLCTKPVQEVLQRLKYDADPFFIMTRITQLTRMS